MIAQPNIIIPWKGRTFNEVVSVKKKNIGTSGNMYKAHPLKLYRRESGAVGCGERSSASTRTMDVPGFTTVNSSATNCNGLSGTKDFNYTELKCESGALTNGGVCFSKENDAKRRVRSSGMPKNNYFTNTNQYLEKRAKTFKQNQYAVIRQGDATSIPGTFGAQQNIYSSYGVTKCKMQFPNTVSFTYEWWGTDGADPTVGPSNNVVTIPAGEYSIDDVNKIFQDTMISNYHYIVQKNGKVKVMLMNLVYNRALMKIEFNTTVSSGAISFSQKYSDANGYEMPKDESNTTVTTWTLPTVTISPGAYSPGITVSNVFLHGALGLNGIYPRTGTNQTANIASTLAAEGASWLSSLNPGLKSKYIEVQYKPSNHQYSTQGAVSSSSRIARLKYNSITNSSVAYNTAYGAAVANALAYGVPSPGYTEKDKIGYPIKKTPVFILGEREKRCCFVKTIRNLM